MADLEAKHEQAQHENENLKDLLSRLQSENVALKQSSFTFTVPKNGVNTVESPNAQQQVQQQSPFSSVSSPVASTSASSQTSPKMTNPLDWSSLTSFDPTMLNLLDDSIPQPTATEGAMQMDFGFGANTGLASNAPYTTIASNPMFISFASTFDSLTPPSNEASTSSTPAPGSNNFSNNTNLGYNFDMNSLSTWSTPSSANHDTILDDLFSGYLTSTGAMDISMLSQSPAAISPVAHHSAPKSRSPAAASSSSSSSSPSAHGSNSMFTTPRDSPASEMDHGDSSGCPKTKTELQKHIADQGASPFAPPINLRKSSDSVLGTMISCVGSNFPKTAKSDKNVEVLSAWRSIRADPKFKDTDINELCSEFTNKARCDGTKVVLEPSGVHSILENLSKKQ